MQWVTFVKILEENDCYRINLVNFESYYSSRRELIELYGKAKDEIFFIARKDNWEVYYKELSELGKSFSQEEGFFKEYGNCDHPLAEFENKLRVEILEKYDMIERVRTTASIYKFWGNHEDYSGMFAYYIWDEDIISEIKERLKREKAKLKRRLKNEKD